MKKVAFVMILIVMASGLMSAVGSAENQVNQGTPTISIYPSTIIAPYSNVEVYGKNWIPNGMVRIDLILPDNTNLMGVSSATVNANGTFKATFIAPNVYGNGYIKAVENTTIITMPVFFNGKNNEYSLNISWYPKNIYPNKTAEFTITAPFLKGKDYVMQTMIYYINKEVIYYSVMHDGYALVYMKFDNSGKYFVTFNIESTPYNKTIDITVLSGSGNGNGGGSVPNKGNFTITITPHTSSQSAIIKVIGANGNLLSGSLRVIYPDGTISVYPISDGIGEIKLKNTGNYLLIFKDNKTGTSKSITWKYSVSVNLQANGFQNSNQCSLTIYVGNSLYTGNAIIKVTKPDGTIDSIQYNGETVEYTAKENGVYKFSTEVMGEMSSTSLSFQDIPVIQNVVAYQTEDKNYIIITGEVYGKYTHMPLSGVTVTATSWQLTEGKATAITDSTGNFRIKITLYPQDRGQEVDITLKVGSTEKQTSLYVEHSLSDNTGWFILGGIILIISIIVLLIKLGYIKIRRRGSNKSGGMFNYGGLR